MTHEQIHEEWTRTRRLEHGTPQLPRTEEGRRTDTIAALHEERRGVEVRLRKAQAMGTDREQVPDLSSPTGFSLGRNGNELAVERLERLGAIDAEISRLSQAGALRLGPRGGPRGGPSVGRFLLGGPPDSPRPAPLIPAPAALGDVAPANLRELHVAQLPRRIC